MPLTAAIIGTGFMGWVHSEALRRCGIKVVGVLGSSPRKSKEAASQIGAEHGYESLEELLSDSRAQVVHIASPNRTHFQMACDLIANGKHVLCEKPLAMTATQSSHLAELASKSQDVVTSVNYNIRYYPLCSEARQRIQQHELGRIFHITGSYTQDWLLYANDYNWRVLSEEGGELRAIADIGTHWLDLLQSISGLEVTAVCADLRTIHKKRERPMGEVETFQKTSDEKIATESIDISTEDFATVLLSFSNDVSGCLHVSQVCAGRKNSLKYEIAGEFKSLSWNSETPNELKIGHRDRANEVLIRDPSLLGTSARMHSDYPGGHNEGFADTFKQHFREFYDYIEAGDFSKKRTFPTFEDGHRELRICEAILASHKKRGWVEI